MILKRQVLLLGILLALKITHSISSMCVNNVRKRVIESSMFVTVQNRMYQFNSEIDTSAIA